MTLREWWRFTLNQAGLSQPVETDRVLQNMLPEGARVVSAVTVYTHVEPQSVVVRRLPYDWASESEGGLR